LTAWLDVLASSEGKGPRFGRRRLLGRGAPLDGPGVGVGGLL